MAHVPHVARKRLRAFSGAPRSRHSDYMGAARQPAPREAGPKDNPG
jgi:hypothetical protein